MSKTINIFSLLGEAKPETQVRNLTSQFEYNKTQVLYLTKMDIIQYDNYLTDMGYAWLDHIAKVVDLVSFINNKFFWQWWRFQWSSDDAKFLTHIYETEKSKLWMYRVMHEYIFDLTEPEAVSLLDDFKSFYGDFIKAASNESKG